MDSRSREAFLSFLARTSGEPAGPEVATAEGAWITDAGGRRYLDFLAGVGVCNTGHRHPRVLAAIRAHLDRHLHVMVYGEYLQEAQVGYAKRLTELAPFPDARVFFANSGAEAVEGALKLARKRTRRAKFVAFDRSYHGNTMAAMSVLGVEAMRAPFGPLLDAEFLPFGDAASLARVDDRVAAVVVEPIQAEGGVRVPPDGFLPAVRKRCDETGALLIVDEVQTGLGRTGRLWAAGVRPDVLVLAKALGGGLPLGAFLAPAALMRELAEDPPLNHLTTFGGHPLSCAAGLAALEVTLAEDLPARAARLGALAVDRLPAARGRGLLIGLPLASPAAAGRVVRKCRETGLLVGSALHDEAVLRLTPPLTLTDDEFGRGLEILTAALG